MSFTEVDKSKPHTIIEIHHPCKLSWYRNGMSVGVGTLFFQGDLRSKVRDVASRRLIQARVISLEYVPEGSVRADTPVVVPEVTFAPIVEDDYPVVVEAVVDRVAEVPVLVSLPVIPAVEPTAAVEEKPVEIPAVTTEEKPITVTVAPEEKPVVKPVEDGRKRRRRDEGTAVAP